MTGEISGAIFYFLTPEQEKFVVKKLTLPIFNICFMITALITYSYILYKLIHRKKRLHTNSGRNSTTDDDKDPKRRNDLAKVYFVAGLIVLNFDFLIAIPSFVNLIYYNKLINRISVTLWYTNYAVDPCIYIFMQSSVRKLLKKQDNIVWRQLGKT